MNKYRIKILKFKIKVSEISPLINVYKRKEILTL